MHATVRPEPDALAADLPALAPLGVPLSVELGRASVPPALAAAFEVWEGNGAPGSPPLCLRIHESDALTGTEPPEFSMREGKLELSSGSLAAVVDPVRGHATCEVSADYLAAPARLREDVLEPLVLTMVSRRDRTPLHAAGFIAGGTAILLAGRSGAGKSCLAKAADDAGYQLLSDDTVYVQLRPGLRVWGWPRAAHLFPRDAAGVTGPTRLRNGKLKRAAPLRSESRRAVSCDRAVLCVLGRGERLALSPLDAADAFQRLLPLEPGFDLVSEQVRSAVRALAQRGAWELRLTDDPGAAVRFVVDNLSRLAERAAP